MIGIILAGGKGTRLWPFSRTQNPKQFLHLGSDDLSLLQETYQRLTSLISTENIYVIGAKIHQFELIRQIEEIEPKYPMENILLEPMSRNTAPAILWGILQLPPEKREEVVVILPADHLIQNQKLFLSYLQEGEQLAKMDKLVTFGIQPDRPETGYGYIQSGKKLRIGYAVEKFVEKPNLQDAEKYIKDQKYTWNSGIFLGKGTTFIEEYKTSTPQLYAPFAKKEKEGKSLLKEENIAEIFNAIIGESIDYAIMEKSKQVAVLPIENIDWSDLGSWESIYQISPKDDSGNVIRGNVIAQDTNNSLIVSSRKLVTTIGVSNLVIVETDDALLVSDLSKSQDVKTLVETLRMKNREEFFVHTKVIRPWGSYTTLLEENHYKIRFLEILPGKRQSLQRHQHRSEHWVVIKGTAEVYKNHTTFFLTKDQSTFISPTEIHRIGNQGKVPLELFEVQMGDYVGSDDIERLEDDFGRV